MRVLISGGTGMIGSSLARSLLADGHQVWVLTRKPQKTRAVAGVNYVGWDGRTSAGWGELINQVDAVVNLAGTRLAKWPWTKRQKRKFWDSRVNSGRALAEAIHHAIKSPEVLIQASGVNYYGPHGRESLTEADPAGNDFLAGLSLEWEDSTRSIEEFGVRRVIIRSAVVLSNQDGILPILALPVRLFVGGPLGNGRQGFPWIHIDDEVSAIRFLLENIRAVGPFNLTVPHPLSSVEFNRQLAQAYRQPFWLPIPSFLLHLVLGEMSDLLLKGVYVEPRHLIEMGFKFKYENLDQALLDLISRNKRSKDY